MVRKKDAMIGARVSGELDEAIRAAAKANGQGVSEYINNALQERVDGTPHVEKVHVKRELLEVAERVMHLRQTKAKLEEMDESFLGLFGDPKIQKLIKNIEHEIDELVNTLPEVEEEEDDGW